MANREYHNLTICPGCGREFKSLQGQLAHVRNGYGPANPGPGLADKVSESEDATKSTTREPTVKELEEQARRLELRERIARLENQRQPRQTKMPDLGELAGLVPMTEKVRDEVQSSAFSTP